MSSYTDVREAAEGAIDLAGRPALSANEMPRLRAFQRSCTPQKVLEILAALRAAEKERDHFKVLHKTEQKLCDVLAKDRDRLREGVEALERQAQNWKGEDRGHKSSLYECYQAVTNVWGEPVYWHGSRPVVDCIASLRSRLDEAREALKAAREVSSYGNGSSHVICHNCVNAYEILRRAADIGGKDG